MSRSRADEIEIYVPVSASAAMSLKKPDGWEDLSLEQRVDLFLKEGEINAGLCHHCSEKIESDLEILDEYARSTVMAEMKDIMTEETV